MPAARTIVPTKRPGLTEVGFLESRGARVISIEGGHNSMFENTDAAQEISDALQE